MTSPTSTAASSPGVLMTPGLVRRRRQAAADHAAPAHPARGVVPLADGAVPADEALRAVPPRRPVVLPVDGARQGARRGRPPGARGGDHARRRRARRRAARGDDDEVRRVHRARPRAEERRASSASARTRFHVVSPGETKGDSPRLFAGNWTRACTELAALRAGRRRAGDARLLELVAADDAAPTTVREPREAVDVHVADSLSGLEVAGGPGGAAGSPISAPAPGSPGWCWRRRCPTRGWRWSRASGRSARSWSGRSRRRGSANVEVVCARAEEWPTGIGLHDVVTARALAPLGVLAEYAAPLLRVGGTLVAWKGARDPAEEAAAERAAARARARAGRRSCAVRALGGRRAAAPLPLLEGYGDTAAVPSPTREWPANGHSEPEVEAETRRFGTESSPLVRPRAGSTLAARWGRCTRSPTRRAASARRPPRSTSRRASPRPAIRRCSSTSTRRRTRPSGSGRRRTGARASTTSSRARPRPPTRCVDTEIERLRLLPAHPDLAGANVELPRRPGSEGLLREALAPVRDRFAYTLLDCPPSLGPLTVNALVAADRVIVPVQTEYFALEGLAGLLDTLALVQRELNPRLTVAGMLLTMHDGRTRLAPRRRARGARALPVARLRDRHPAQRPRRRGAELRPPGHPPRPALRRVGRLLRARQGGAARG